MKASRINHRKLCLFLALFVAYSFSFIGKARAESLLDVYQLAKGRDPKFKAAEHLYQASRETTPQAWAALRPNLSANWQTASISQNIISSDNTVFGQGKSDYDSTEYNVSVIQPIFRYSEMMRVRQAKIETKKADMEYRAAGQELMLRVAELYFGVLAARDTLEYTESERLSVEQQFKLAEGRNRMGLAPITDLYDAKARLATVTASRIEAENVFDDALEALNEACGDRIDKFSSLMEEVPLLPPVPAEAENWIQLANEYNTALRVQQFNVQAAEQEIKRLKGGHYPTVDLTWRRNNRNTEGTLFGGGSEVETDETILQFNLPLYQGGGVSSKTREAIEVLQSAKEVLEQHHRSASRQARAAYFGIRSAISRVNALKQGLTSQELALKMKQQGFKSGLFASLAVLDAERDYYMAKRDYAQARYDYVLNTLRLKKAVGMLEERDIEKLNNWLMAKAAVYEETAPAAESRPDQAAGQQ